MTISIDGTTGITLPSGGIAVGTTDSQTLTNKTLTSTTINSGTINSGTINTPTITGGLSLGTAASLSGTAVNITGIPSWAKRVTVIFSAMSGNGTASPLIQIGSAGSVEVTGYAAAGSGGSTTAATSTYTTGFGIRSAAAADSMSGSMVLHNITGTTWVSSHVVANSGGSYFLGGGTKTLADTLDRIRLTFTNGTDSFDAGTVNIIYE